MKDYAVKTAMEDIDEETELDDKQKEFINSIADHTALRAEEFLLKYLNILVDHEIIDIKKIEDLNKE